jgi:hypothetical protein
MSDSSPGIEYSEKGQGLDDSGRARAFAAVERIANFVTDHRAHVVRVNVR